jgi:hypothetical protein
MTFLKVRGIFVSSFTSCSGCRWAEFRFRGVVPVPGSVSIKYIMMIQGTDILHFNMR